MEGGGCLLLSISTLLGVKISQKWNGRTAKVTAKKLVVWKEDVVCCFFLGGGKGDTGTCSMCIFAR